MGNWGLNNVVDPITINSEDAEEMPSFPGGDMEMSKFIQKMYKLPIYLDRSEQGTIYVKFVVSEKGEIKNVSIERGINPDMDKEAMRVVKAMPNWTPGKYRGRNVSVRMIIPIKIRYQ
jgi:protein TonB